MNHEILFRGKRKDNNEWVYGDLIHDWDDLFIGGDFLDETGNPMYMKFEVIPETVGQYTNFNDNKSNKIFDGDIVEEGCNGLILDVIYDNEIGTYKLKGTENYFIKDAPIEWEVVGNIWDNPELLDEEVK